MGKSFLQQIDAKQKVIFLGVIFFMTFIMAMFVYSGLYSFIFQTDELSFLQDLINADSWHEVLAICSLFFLWLVLIIVKFKVSIGG